ncbi:hypothetical protein LC612_30120 [Nostoc sp. CHAB 5834]|nr:hypothetical protein [Nostoc sp. CHAB 5834]
MSLGDWLKAIEEGELCYTLMLPLETPSNNTIRSMHFREYKSLREGWQLVVASSIRGPRRPPLPRPFLCVERYCSGQGLDWDNAYGGLKPVLDCLVRPTSKNPSGLGLIEDDNLKVMPIPPLVTQLPADAKQGRTVIKIYNLPSVA